MHFINNICSRRFNCLSDKQQHYYSLLISFEAGVCSVCTLLSTLLNVYLLINYHTKYPDDLSLLFDMFVLRILAV